MEDQMANRKNKMKRQEKGEEGGGDKNRHAPLFLHIYSFYSRHLIITFFSGFSDFPVSLFLPWGPFFLNTIIFNFHYLQLFFFFCIDLFYTSKEDVSDYGLFLLPVINI